MGVFRVAPVFLAAWSAVAAPAWAQPARPRLLVMDLKAQGVRDALARQCAGLVAESLAEHGDLDVVTTDDLAKVLSVEETRRLLGCEAESCVAELASGARADLVVTGSVGSVGSALTINLVLLDGKAATVRNRAAINLPSLRDLEEQVRRGVTALMGWSGSAAAPGFTLPAGQATSFAVLDLVASGVAEQVAANLTAVLSTELKRVQGASVISRDDVKALLQLETDRSKLGCDDASCLAEIGGALGVERLVVGSVGKLADTYLVSLRLIQVRTVKVEHRVSESFVGTEDQLLRAIRHAARRLLGITPEQAGALAVSTSQAGTTLLVDDQVRGTLPMAPLTGLAPGSHRVQLRKPGWFDWNGDVYVDPAEATPLWVELNAKPLAWYQRWWVWAGAAGVTGLLGVAALAVVVAGVTGGALGAYYVWRLTSTPDDHNGRGTATLE